MRVRSGHHLIEWRRLEAVVLHHHPPVERRDAPKGHVQLPSKEDLVVTYVDLQLVAAIIVVRLERDAVRVHCLKPAEEGAQRRALIALACGRPHCVLTCAAASLTRTLDVLGLASCHRGVKKLENPWLTPYARAAPLKRRRERRRASARCGRVVFRHERRELLCGRIECHENESFEHAALGLTVREEALLHALPR